MKGKNIKSGKGLAVFVISLILALLGYAAVLAQSSGECAYQGCGSRAQSGSHYCAFHDMQIKSDKKIREQESVSSKAVTVRTEKVPTEKVPSVHTEQPKSRRADSEGDKYGAGRYYHPDDFYYDHYDDFYDYEDAEDYWYEHHDD